MGLFGGSAPQGTDHERGFHAVKTHEEEAQREADADKPHDPWSVTFVPDDETNPKVCLESRLDESALIDRLYRTGATRVDGT